MQTTSLTLSPQELGILAELVGSDWIALSGARFPRPTFAWQAVTLLTTTLTVRLELARERVDIAGETDLFPALHVSRAARSGDQPAQDETTYFHDRGSRILSIWVVRETVVGNRTLFPDFVYIADVAVVFGLENSWIAVARGSHFQDAFLIQRSARRESLEIPDSSGVWESDLLDQYTVSREWIPIEPTRALDDFRP